MLEEAWARAAGSGSSAVDRTSSHGGDASSSQPKGLSFDPLARGPRRAQHGGSHAPPSMPGGSHPEGVDVLSEGLTKLLAELAQGVLLA